MALAPHLVEVAYEVGAGNKLIAAVDYSNYPEAAKSLPRVGGYTGVNVEAIVRLNPDLILAWKSGNSEKHLKQLENLGFQVYYSEPKTLEDIALLMEDVTRLTASKAGVAKVAEFRDKLSRLKTKYQSQNKVSVFYQVWNQPLQSLNGQSIVSDVIDLCGGVNVFHSAKSIAPKLSVETVLRKNPDVIVASGMGEERPQWLDEWRRWPSLSAVKNDHLFFIPPDLIQRHSPRLLEGASILCEQLSSVRQRKAN
ncbi:cobalamin-binding protein [uncultured Pseudoteredinibacter sp.]|uniref:cobalamin-binding protein n=1 Tax=uncultured Pseudoteredinibacter sp. TaxID=1641701 RepID=UPI0026112D84|nr:cobalamin-binding protein [uncultured Pseudoteredinibacter sp.]